MKTTATIIKRDPMIPAIGCPSAELVNPPSTMYAAYAINGERRVKGALFFGARLTKRSIKENRSREVMNHPLKFVNGIPK